MIQSAEGNEYSKKMEKAGDRQPSCWQDIRDHRQTEQQRLSVCLCDTQIFITFIKQHYYGQGPDYGYYVL